jgi:hypothetical protein
MSTLEEHLAIRLHDLGILSGHLLYPQKTLLYRLAYLIRTQPEWDNHVASIVIELGLFHNPPFQTFIIALQRRDKQYRPVFRVWAPRGADMETELKRIVTDKWWDWMGRLENHGDVDPTGHEITWVYNDLSTNI